MKKRNGQRLIFIFYYYCIILLWGFTLSLHAYLYKRELVGFFNANLVKMQTANTISPSPQRLLGSESKIGSASFKSTEITRVECYLPSTTPEEP